MCPAAWRHGRREVRNRSRGHPWPGVGRRVAQKNITPVFHRITPLLVLTDEKRGRGFRPSRISLTPGIPDFSLFGVVVADVLDASLLHVVHHLADGGG